MNADDALKCIELSKKKYKAGDYQQALKYAEKSLRLYHTIDGEKWLSFLNANPKSATDSKPNSPKERKAKVSDNAEESTRPYTPEQQRAIKNILACHKKGDLYGILGLEKDASDIEIKKSYRKLALRLHPDKCGAPNTDDAFKAISHAWTVLGDESKKSDYDRFGVDSESSEGRRAQGRNPFGQFPHNHTGFQFQGGEIDPEELLRAFMGGQFGNTAFTFNTGNPFRRPQRNNRTQDQSASSTILQLLPVLLILFLTMFSMFSAEDDYFQFRKSYEYSQELDSTPHKIKYYVKPEVYRRKFNTKRRQADLNSRVEDQVWLIDKYLQHLRYQCSQEKETKAYHIRKSKRWLGYDEEELKRAQDMPLPTCQRVQDWYNY